MKINKKKSVIIKATTSAGLISSVALGVGLGIGLNNRSQIYNSKQHSLEQSNQYLATGSKLIYVQLDKKQYANKRVIAVFLDKSQKEVKNYQIISFTNANGLASISTADLPNPGIYQLDHIIDPITNQKIITAKDLTDQQKQEIVKPIFVQLIPNELNKGLGTLIIGSNDHNFINHQIRVSLVSALDGKQVDIKGIVDQKGNIVANASSLIKTIEYQIIRVTLDEKIPTAIVNPYDLVNDGRINVQGNSRSEVEKDSVDRPILLKYEPKSRQNQQTSVIQDKSSSLELDSPEVGSSNSQAINDHSGSNVNSELLVGKTNITQDTFSAELPSKVKDRDFVETEKVETVKPEKESDQEIADRIKLEKELEEARKKQQEKPEPKSSKPEEKEKAPEPKTADKTQEQSDEAIKLKIEEDGKSIIEAEIRRLEEEKQRLIQEVIDRENAEKEAKRKAEEEAKRLEEKRLKAEEEKRLAEQERIKKEQEEKERLEKIKKLQEEAKRQELELKQKIQEREELQALEKEKERLRKEAEALAELLRKKEAEELAKKREQEELKKKEQEAILQAEERKRQEELRKAEEAARQKAQEELIAKQERIRIETERKKVEEQKRAEEERQRKETEAAAARVALERAAKDKEAQEAILRQQRAAKEKEALLKKQQLEREQKLREQKEQEEKRRQIALREQQEKEKKTNELKKKKQAISDAISKLSELSKEEQDKFKILINQYKDINNPEKLNELLVQAEEQNNKKLQARRRREELITRQKREEEDERKRREAELARQRQIAEEKKRQEELRRKLAEEKRILEEKERIKRLEEERRQREREEADEKARIQAIIQRINQAKEATKNYLKTQFLRSYEQDQLTRETEALKSDPNKETEIKKALEKIKNKANKFAQENQYILKNKKYLSNYKLENNKVLFTQQEYRDFKNRIDKIIGKTDADKAFDSIDKINEEITNKNEQIANSIRVVDVQTYGIHKEIPANDKNTDSTKPLGNITGKVGGELEIELSRETQIPIIWADIETPKGLRLVKLYRDNRNSRKFKVNLSKNITPIEYIEHDRPTTYKIKNITFFTDGKDTKYKNVDYNKSFEVPSLLAKYENVNAYRISGGKEIQFSLRFIDPSKYILNELENKNAFFTVFLTEDGKLKTHMLRKNDIRNIVNVIYEGHYAKVTFKVKLDNPNTNVKLKGLNFLAKYEKGVEEYLSNLVAVPTNARDRNILDFLIDKLFDKRVVYTDEDHKYIYNTLPYLPV
ncbi:hypothetical protein JM47_00065 [Ureaplasma diversum]|uniref:Uncharacterized protein n=1 Tax=Ureaplasma diversum TaxID=42094 RepID=A0A0C5RAW5_9BACT|nr:hypothetical protein [Ureaplasma diversum]AJQ45076.1 hypothetical protein JM47_00065 [Ureaplasma diversum]